MNRQSLRNKLLDLFFPPRCVICNAIVHSGACVCGKCNDKVFLLDDIQTAKVKNENFDGICIAPYLYDDKIKELMIAYKFQQKTQYARLFGEKLAEALIKKGVVSNFELITCVPISKERFKERGYHQSKLIAKYVAECLNLPYIDCILKIKHNGEQHLLNVAKRKENVKGVYDMRENKHITNKKLLLIDDIVTTGYTLAECAALLKKKGVKSVLCGAVAYRPNIYLNDQNPFIMV